MMRPSDVAGLYLAAPDASAALAPMVREYVARTRRTFERLPYRVVFTPRDPYATAEHMAGQARSTGVLAVYTGGSEGRPWSPLDNWRMRAVHDVHDHMTSGVVPFDFTGEVEACVRAVARCGEAFAPLLVSEVVLQAAVASTSGHFAAQKLVNIDGRLCARILGR